MKIGILKILKYIPLLFVTILLHFTATAQLSVSITGNFEGCSPQILVFGCNVTGASGEVSYSWSSGNGDVSVLAEPTFSYLTPGHYNISVTVESNGQTASDSHEIVIFNGPTASFNDSTIVGCAPKGYSFRSSATEGDAEITSWIWYFGDGVSAQGRYRAHTYTSPGVYTVSLEVTDANGCRDEYHSQMLTLSKRPDVSISANDAQWCVAPHEVNFSSQISTDAGLGGPYTTTWDFGDGNESNEDNPSHTYESTGSYNVSITVIDSYGCKSVVRENNMVVIGTLTPTCTVPEEICLNIPFTFSSDVDDDMTCYWDFGDGTPTQSGGETSHAYSQVGNYSVSFTVDPNGPCRQTQIFNVNVVDVHASFRTEPEDLFSCTYPFEVRFISTSVGENLTYTYNFDDRLIGFDEISTHSYSQNGRFTPTLTVTSPGGCVSRFTGSEIVVNQPEAALHSTTAGGCVPATIGFYNDPEYTSNSAVVDFFWNFGDGTSVHTATSSVEHVYAEFGTFYPTLTITDTSGCSATSPLLERPLESIITGTQVSPEQFGVTDAMHNFIPGDTICPRDTVYLYNSMYDNSEYNYFFVISAGSMSWDVNSDAEYTTYSFEVDTGWNNVGFTIEYRNCLSPVQQWDSVYVEPPIVHVASYNDCSAPLVYSFKLTENLGAEYWEWHIWNADNNNRIMDVSHSTVDSISIVFPGYGHYRCNLVAHNDGANCEYEQEIVCNIMPPTFNWEISTDTLCLGNRLTAVVLSAPAFSEVAFDWEGRGVPTDQLEWIQINGITDSRYTYEQGGNYEVVAYARQHDGCISVFTKQLYVVDPHSSISPTNLVVGCNPATFEFHNITNTDDPIYSATWNFGDGTENVPGENVTHTYEEAGIYDVSLELMTWHGCSFSGTFRERVKVLDFPYADVDFTPNVCFGTVQTFVSGESDNSIWHEWDFGDGTTISGTNSTINHLYELPGIYSFTHIVSVRSDGIAVCSDTLPCEYCISIERFVSADFTIDSSAYNCYPVSPSIHTAIVTEPDYVNLRYNWDMGNGDIVHVANPQYLYTAPGDYTINLEVTTYSGCSTSMSHNVTITGPEANISLSDTLVCAGGEVHFSMTDAVNVESFIWVVGGGYNYYTEEVTHQYDYVPESGYFPVTLSIRNGNCMIDLTEQVYVYRINSDFSLLDLNGNAILEGSCSPLEGNLAYSGTNGVEQRWYLNGEILTDGNSVSWTNSSTQMDSLNVVSLAITDSLGCIDSISHEYLVYRLPEVHTFGDTLICKGGEAQISVVGGSAYYWEFPIDDSAQIQKISPNEATFYYVFAFSEKGCSKLDSVMVDVMQDFDAGVYEQSLSINIGDTATALVFSDMEQLNCYISPAEFAFAENCDTLLLYPLENTDFTLILKDTLGCYEKTIDIHVDVDIKYTLDVPGAFTPLSEDENSVVYVRGLGIKRLLQFRIFNRWGEEVFFTDDLHTGWDGTISGKVQNMDTYSYYVEAEMFDGSIKTKKGNIVLMK